MVRGSVTRANLRRYPRRSSGVAVRCRSADPGRGPEQVGLLADISQAGARLEVHGLEAVAARAHGRAAGEAGRVHNLEALLGNALVLQPLGEANLWVRARIVRMDLGAGAETTTLGIQFEEPLDERLAPLFGL